ncbi:hypothetical protein BH09BAC6_BH09BAC6_11960 [soil metagenome]|jgi:hypothetical protein
MKQIIKGAAVAVLMLLFFACKTPVPVPQYSMSKVFRTDTGTIVNVHINNRLPAEALVAIAGKVKSDSVKIKSLILHYLLPGNRDISAGDNSYYASAKYIHENDVKATDTLKDENGNVLRLKIWGLSLAKAKHLLTLHPTEIAGKNILGRYIDDYSHTVIIPFTNPQDKKSELYLIELDSTAKVVSATIPLRIKADGEEKWQVTPNGDYITLKDSVLTQYGINGRGVPFNSIKSGI